MNALLPVDSVIPVLTSISLLLILSVPGLLFYGRIANNAEFEGIGKVGQNNFGRWDALAGATLGVFFALLSIAGLFGPAQEATAVSDQFPGLKLVVLSVVKTEVVFVTILLGIGLILHTGGFSWWRSLGLQPRSMVWTGAQAGLLLLLAYPLIVDSLQLWRVLIASVGYIDDTKQDAVRFLAESKSEPAKLIVALQAVLLAPVQEELIFRGYLYGLIRRYLGVGAGLFISAALFAGIHTHLPSFAGLFTLAVCLALAYEWTGSIFVPMAMHALFNLLSVLVLFQ